MKLLKTYLQEARVYRPEGKLCDCAWWAAVKSPNDLRGTKVLWKVIIVISTLWHLTDNWSQQSPPVIKKGGKRLWKSGRFNALSTWWGNMLAMLATWCLTIPTSMLAKHREWLTWLLCCNTTKRLKRMRDIVLQWTARSKKRKKKTDIWMWNKSSYIYLIRKLEWDWKCAAADTKLSQTEAKPLNRHNDTKYTVLTPNTILMH